MQINIQARDFPLTDALRDHTERRLRIALTYSEDHVQRVVMRLSDISSPCGGAGKCCHLQVVLPGLPDVVVEDVEADLSLAIERATDRVGRIVVRKIGLQQMLLRQGHPPILNAQV